MKEICDGKKKVLEQGEEMLDEKVNIFK